jgi:hypothetical protein
VICRDLFLSACRRRHGRQFILTIDSIDRAVAVANVGRFPHLNVEHGDFDTQQ